MANSWLAFVVMLILILGLIGSARAEDKEAGHEVKQREKIIEEIEEKEESGAENINLIGYIETNYEYLDVKDVGDKSSGSSSDFFIGSVTLALSAIFNEWSKALVAVEFEDIDRGDDLGNFRLDEATVALKVPWIPLYFIGGKRVMPFGVFEDRLIEGTLAEDLYEIDEWGATLGLALDFFGLDISLSIYEDASIMNNLEDFDIHEFRPEHPKEDRFDSYIANVTLAPVGETFILSAFFDSEPGDGRRNQSIGAALTLDFWQFILDLEYITALQRENGENGEENKERVAVAGLAFDVLDWLQLATRYEDLDDENPGDQDEVLDYRIIAGFNYYFLEHIDIPELEDAAFSFEYRFSKYEKEKDSQAADSQTMLQFQLAIEF